MKQYLIANPAIVVDKFPDRLLLINLLNKELSEVENGNNGYALIENLFGEEANGIIDFEDDPTVNPDLIANMIEKDYAQKLNTNSSIRPISFNRNETVILKDPQKILLGVSPEENYYSIGRNIYENISETYIFCGGNCSVECKACTSIIKSHPACNCESTAISSFDLLALVNLASKLRNKTTIIVNEYDQKQSFFLEHRNLLSNIYIGINALEYLKNEKEVEFIFENRIIIYFPSSLIKPSILEKFKTKNKKELMFFVEEEENLNIIESYITNSSFEHSVKLKPVYNGSNADFITENVYVSKEEIISCIRNTHEIEIRKKINSFFWGKVYFYSGQRFKTSLYQNSYFELEKTSIPDAIYKAMSTENDWNLTRNKVESCNNCNFRFLCPPISNIEKTMNQFKICKL